jgi:hypothetical protein
MTGKAGSAEDKHAPIRLAAKESFQRFDMKPFPAVRIISEDGHLKAHEYARAVLYESGREEIWISADVVGRDDLHVILDHETAHLKAWREHGPRISEHGVIWRRVCRTYALSLKACEDKH